MTAKPFAFHDFPASAFPFTAELLDAATGEVRWSATVDGPGSLRIPGCEETNGGRPLRARTTFADGEVVEDG
jgi:hypothetical protein